jgi:hypothetical protein
MRTAFLHINGTDYELPACYAEEHSPQLNTIKRQAHELIAGGPGMITVQVVLRGETADLSINAEAVVASAVFVTEEAMGKLLV